MEAEAPPLLKFTIVSQPGLPRRQIYYPYISFRLSRPLQVPTTVSTLLMRLLVPVLWIQWHHFRQERPLALGPLATTALQGIHAA